jgi:exodeoxyribonuclease VII small subunit
MTKKTEEFSYSSAINELDEIANYLESPEVDLDEAIKKFERGKELAAAIEKHLERAENVIKSIKDKA